MPQRIQTQPVIPFGRGIAQSIGRQTVTQFMDRQAQQHRQQADQQIQQRVQIQRVEEICEIIQP